MSSPRPATQTESERSFASSAVILGALSDGALVVDLSGIVRQANAAAARLLGVAAGTLPGSRLADLPGAANLCRPAGAERGRIEVDGRPLRFDRRPLLSDDGQDSVVGTIILLRDCTAELAAKHEQYEHIARALHDVRVPLQAIGGAAEGLLRGWFGPLTDEQREFVVLIKENAGRQGDLFSNLFDVYTLAAGLVQLHAERLSIEGVLHEVVQEFASRFEERTIDLSLDMPETMAPVLADRRRLGQILVILIQNACKYTFPGGAVALRARDREGEICVEVQDSGVGIRAVDQPKIFTPFFRGESPLKEGRYGGLSLAIARMLVELHGGRLWFVSVEGQGSTFSFTLPISPR